MPKMSTPTTSDTTPLPVLPTVRRAARRPLEEADMDITPMIDITFLLLIFFIVGTKIGDKTDVQLPPAQHGTQVLENQSIVLTLRLSGDQVAVLGSIGTGERTPLGPAASDVDGPAIQAYVETMLARAGTLPQVIVMADRDVKQRVVAAVARAVAEAGDVGLFLGVLEEHDRS